MGEGEKDKRANSKNAIIEVYMLLWEETDEFHGMTVQTIHDRLIERHAEDDTPYLAPSVRTIYNQLNWLSLQRTGLLGRTVRKVNMDDARAAHCPDAAPGWYMTPYLTVSELSLLTDSLMLSRIDAYDLKSLQAKLARITGGHGGAQNMMAPTQIDSYEHTNETFLGTIGTVNRAIAMNCCVRFRYCDYGPDGTLVERCDAGGKPRIYRLDPYRMVYKTGRYFLIGHFHDRPLPTGRTQDENHTNLFCFVVDRITHIELQANEPIVIPMEAWDEEGTPLSDNPEIRATQRPFDPVRFARTRPHMTMGSLEDVVMKLHPDMLTPFYEYFDSPEWVKPLPQRTKDERPYYGVKVRAPEMGVAWWVLQYAEWGNVQVIEPQALRQRLEQAGMTLLRMYGTR